MSWLNLGLEGKGGVKTRPDVSSMRDWEKDDTIHRKTINKYQQQPEELVDREQMLQDLGMLSLWSQ